MGSIIPTLLILCLKCAVLASLFVLDIPLAAKVLLGTVFGFMWLVLVAFDEILEKLGKLHLYARLTFTALEMHRRTPGNEQLAWDRLNEDLKFEKEREDILSFGRTKLSGGVTWGLEIVILAVGTFVFYFLFQIIK